MRPLIDRFAFFAFLYIVSSSVLEPAELRNCDLDGFLLMKHQCFPSILGYIVKEHQTDGHQEAENLAKHAIDCLNERNCREASAVKLSIQENMEPHQNPNTDQVLCLKTLFRRAYNSHESNVYECLRNYDLLNYNLTKRREAFNEGKSCLIEFMSDNCTPDSFKYFHDKYQLLTDVMSDEQVVKDCFHSFYHLNGIYCRALIDELTHRRNTYGINNIRLDDSLRASTKKLCTETKICFQNSCSPSQDFLKDFDKKCMDIQLQYFD